MQVFIINLKKEIKRRIHMQQLCDKYNLEYEFIEAINGCLLTEETIENIYDKSKTIKIIKRELGFGEIGVALSHRYIYEIITEQNIDKALILEDDVDFDENLSYLLSKDMYFPKNMDILLCGHHSNDSREEGVSCSNFYQLDIIDKFKIKIPKNIGYGAYGYIITNQGAKKLLKALNNKISKPIDHYTGNPQEYNVFAVTPPIIKINKQLDNLSSIAKSRNDKTKNNISKKHQILKKLHLFNSYIWICKIYDKINGFVHGYKAYLKYGINI